MIYSKNPDNGGISIKFINVNEVEAVSAAFQRYNEEVTAKGNTPLTYHETIAEWRGSTQEYSSTKPKPLLDALTELAENTEEDGDKLLDDMLNPNRIVATARRYRVGFHASRIVNTIGLHLEAEEAGPEPMGC
jgi:hypothetical protein